MKLNIGKGIQYLIFFALFSFPIFNCIIQPDLGYCSNKIAVRWGSKIIMNFNYDSQQDFAFSYEHGNSGDEYLAGDWIRSNDLERWDLLTIESIQCIKPAGGVDAAAQIGFAALGAAVGAGVTIATGTAVTVGSLSGSAYSGSSVAQKALNYLDGNFSGQDDLIVQVNGQQVLPLTGKYRAINAGQIIHPNVKVSFKNNVRISLIEYDSGSDNDDLGNISIDSSWMKKNDVHKWEQLIIVAPAAEDGSIYYVTARVDAGKGNKYAVPEWVKCGTAQCIACLKTECAERNSNGLDRDGDEEDLKACPPGYRHYSYQKYPQMWPAEDVYLRICILEDLAPKKLMPPRNLKIKGAAANILMGSMRCSH